MRSAQIRGQMGIAKKKDPNADVTDLQAELKAEVLADRIREAVATWPPLTAAQRSRLAVLLSPPADSSAA